MNSATGGLPFEHCINLIPPKPDPISACPPDAVISLVDGVGKAKVLGMALSGDFMGLSNTKAFGLMPVNYTEPAEDLFVVKPFSIGSWALLAVKHS